MDDSVGFAYRFSPRPAGIRQVSDDCRRSLGGKRSGVIFRSGQRVDLVAGRHRRAEKVRADEASCTGDENSMPRLCRQFSHLNAPCGANAAITHSLLRRRHAGIFAPRAPIFSLLPRFFDPAPQWHRIA